MGTKSAVAIIEETGGEPAMFTTVDQFAMVVNQNYPAFSVVYVERCARQVIEGKFNSIAPSYGTDVFFIKRFDEDTVIATTKVKEEKKLRKYQLLIE